MVLRHHAPQLRQKTPAILAALARLLSSGLIHEHAQVAWGGRVLASKGFLRPLVKEQTVGREQERRSTRIRAH
jgi:hypothetical protein